MSHQQKDSDDPANKERQAFLDSQKEQSQTCEIYGFWKTLYRLIFKSA